MVGKVTAKVKSKNMKNARRSIPTGRPLSGEHKVHRFLAVLDIGENADYSSEPRHVVELRLDFALHGRSSTDRIRKACRHVHWQIQHLLPDGASLHIWLMDEASNGKLFVSGLHMVKEGLLTKGEAKRIGTKVLKQVTGRLQEFEIELLVRAKATVNVEADADEEDDDGNIDEQYLNDLEQEGLDEVFDGFETSWLVDSEYSCGSVSVVGEGWKRLRLQLPFLLSHSMPTRHLRQAIGAAMSDVWQECYSDYEADEDDHDIWLIEDGKAKLNLSLLLDLREGTVSQHQYQKALEHARTDLEMTLPKKRLSA